jgi:hypothetical protein
VRWRRDDRQQPDDSPDLAAEDWLKEFRPVRPDALTAADRDAIRPPPRQTPSSDWDRRAEPAGNGGGPAARGSPARGAPQDDGAPMRSQDYGSSRPADVPPAAPARLSPPSMPTRPANGSYRPHQNEDEYLAGRVLPPRTHRDDGAEHWQSRDGYRGSYPERPRPEESYRPRAGDGYPLRRDDGHESRRYDDDVSRRDDDYPSEREDGYPSFRKDGSQWYRNDSYPPRREVGHPGPRADGYPLRRDDGYPAYREDGYPAYREDGYPAYREDGYRPRREDGYPQYREDGYPSRREDGYSQYREGGYSPRRENAYPPRREDGYPSRREDGYLSRREDDYRGHRGADYAPAPPPESPSILDRQPAPRPAAPQLDYGGYRERPGEDHGPDLDRPDYGGASYDRSGYDRSRHDRPGYDQHRYGQAAASPERPERSALPPTESRPERPAAASQRPPEDSGDLVPPGNQLAVRAEYQPADRSDDDTMTHPLPVILPGAMSVPRPAPVEAPRGPFEPARPSQGPARPQSITGSVEPPPTDYPPPVPPPPRPLPAAAAAKLDQIKDLYVTAEAIGADALDKHFDQVSARQRELISEFFNRSEPGDAPTGRA